MENKHTGITMKDIALECGFSINTVSRVLRGDSRISKETCDKIKAAADRLGYIRNNSASSLRSGKTYTVAVILGDLTNMHNVILLSQIDDCLRKNGYVGMILNSHDDQEIEQQLLEQAISRRVDGIILLPTGNKATSGIRKMQQKHVPFVMVHRTVEGIECDEVDEDDCAGGRLAGQYLLGKDRKQLLYIAGPKANSSEKLRRKGFMEVLKEKGIQHESVRVIEYDEMVEAINQQRVLQILEPVDFDGIFAFYDHFAYQALYSLMKAGYKVPEDISIIGFDNIREGYRYLPPLTTLSTQPGSSIASEAVEMLLKRIEEPDAHAQKVTLPVCIYE